MAASNADGLVVRCRLYPDCHGPLIAELEGLPTRYQRGEFLRRLLELGYAALRQPGEASPTAVAPSPEPAPAPGARDALPATVNQAILDNLDLGPPG